VAADATRKGVAAAGLFSFMAMALGALAAYSGGIGAPTREAMAVSSRV